MTTNPVVSFLRAPGPNQSFACPSGNTYLSDTHNLIVVSATAPADVISLQLQGAYLVTPRNNIDAQANPSSTNDFTQDYGAGSYWINNSPTFPIFWVCTNSGYPTPGTASWKSVLAAAPFTPGQIFPCTVSGTSNALILTPTVPAPTALFDGLEVTYTPLYTSDFSAVCTLNVAGLGAKNLYVPGNQFNAVKNDLIKNSKQRAVFDAAHDRWVQSAPPFGFYGGVRSHGSITLGSGGPTLVAVSAGFDGGLLVYDPASGALMPCVIGAGGIPGGDLTDCTINGVAHQAAASNTFYFMYVRNAQNPTMEFWTAPSGRPGYGQFSILNRGGTDEELTFIGAIFTLNVGGSIDITAYIGEGSAPLRLPTTNMYDVFTFLGAEVQPAIGTTGSTTYVNLGVPFNIYAISNVAAVFESWWRGYVSGTPGITVTLRANCTFTADDGTVGSNFIEEFPIKMEAGGGPVPFSIGFGQALQWGFTTCALEAKVTGSGSCTVVACPGATGRL